MILSVKCLNKKLLFILIISICQFNNSFAQDIKESLILKDQISKLQVELTEQKALTTNLFEKIDDLIKDQNQLILQFTETSKAIKNISQGTQFDQINKFKDAFLLSKDGKKIGLIDYDLKFYEYYSGNLIGWIKPDTNELVRNYDNSVVGIIENDFVLDETGHVIGSIERSENLRWDREKFYAQVQKTPVSQYFIRLENPKSFNLSTFRYSDWSNQKLEDILFFSDKKIQKLK